MKICLFSLCGIKDNKLIIEYSKEDDINISNFDNVIQIPTRIFNFW